MDLTGTKRKATFSGWSAYNFDYVICCGNLAQGSWGKCWRKCLFQRWRAGFNSKCRRWSLLPIFLFSDFQNLIIIGLDEKY